VYTGVVHISWISTTSTSVGISNEEKRLRKDQDKELTLRDPGMPDSRQ
jgi:hypothetical protein